MMMHGLTNLNLNLLYIFSKNTQIPNFMKIRPVRADLFHADRDMKLTVALRHFANAPNDVCNHVCMYVCMYFFLFYI